MNHSRVEFANRKCTLQPMHAAWAMHGRHTKKASVSVLALPMSFQISSTPQTSWLCHLGSKMGPCRVLPSRAACPYHYRRRPFRLNHESWDLMQAPAQASIAVPNESPNLGKVGLTVSSLMIGLCVSVRVIRNRFCISNSPRPCNALAQMKQCWGSKMETGLQSALPCPTKSTHSCRHLQASKLRRREAEPKAASSSQESALVRASWMQS